MDECNKIGKYSPCRQVGSWCARASHILARLVAGFLLYQSGGWKACLVILDMMSTLIDIFSKIPGMQGGSYSRRAGRYSPTG